VAAGLAHDDGGIEGIRATVRSGLEAGLREPRNPPERGAVLAWRGNSAASTAASQKPAEAVPGVSHELVRAMMGGAQSPHGYVSGEREPDEERPLVRHIPMSVWLSRPTLGAIRAYAHSTGCPADAALGYILARWSAAMPHTTRLWAGTLRRTAPNLFVALVAASGVAKSSTATVMTEVVQHDRDVAEILVSTGEGICAAFMGEDPTQAADAERRKGKPKTDKTSELVQVRWNAFITIDEGGVLKKLSARDNATLPMVLRQAHTGTPIGQNNATKGLARRVTDYNIGCIANFTPSAAGSLFDRPEAEGGTPQRFLWFMATDPLFQDAAPRVPMPKIELELPREAMGLIQLDPEMEAEFKAQRAAAIREEAILDPLDGHKRLIIFRVAAFLAVQEGRWIVSRDDWSIASAIWDASCGVREWVIRAVRESQQAEEDERTATYTARAIHSDIARQQAPARIEMYARRVASNVHARQGDGLVTKKDITARMFGSRDGEARHNFTTIMDFAVNAGWLARHGEGGWVKGQARPA
jgi:hypothetical protein